MNYSIEHSIRQWLVIGTIPALFSCAGPPVTQVRASEDHAAWLRAHYDKAEYMIPMRDGVELFTIVYAPKDRSQRYPILLYRTPYSIAPYGPDAYRDVLGPSAEFDREGYIFAFQDVRGKFKSEGDFEVVRPLAPKPKGPTDTDESTDNYDAIEWLLASTEGNNGRVGQWGISYSGWQTVMGMVDAHPALVASSPQASPSDMFVGDDWHHNGAFRIMYAFSWLARNARRRDAPTEERSGPFDYGTPSGYDFFLDAGAASKIDELYFHGNVLAWNDFMEHDTYDEYWQRQNALPHLAEIQPAILNVAGWFDTEDFYGPMSIYRTIEERNPGIENTLIAGPWLHGGWRSMEGDHLGCIEFGSKTSRFFQREVQLPFFEYHLKGKGNWEPSEAVVFETGSNEWKRYGRWPPEGVEATKLFLRAGGKLSFRAPSTQGSDASDSYLSDPNKPVPFSAEIRTTLGHLWKVEDQRFASSRPDVLVYESDVLERDLTIAGPILANIFVSTTGTDSDWVVKLIDVYPGDANNSAFCDVPMGGYQMHLAGEIMRGRFRTSLEKPEPMVPGEVTPINIDLRDRYHTFKAGHRIMVHVQSSWFPAYDRNPQTFVDTYHARPQDYQAATQRVYRSAEYPSHLVLGVMPYPDVQ
jgi:putative CocE/NonD family hydrolase